MKRTPKNPGDKEKILSAALLTNAEARFLVANYYQSQEMRKRSDLQIRHLGPERAEGNVIPEVLMLTAEQFMHAEETMAKALRRFAENRAVGQWCMLNPGVGPIITAGLLAHLDITKAATAGAFWKFTGLDPTIEWNKGEKRPYSADAKQLVYHLGECFKRVSGRYPSSLYVRLYKERKQFIVARNEKGFYAERAKTFITNSADVKKVLKKGMLPTGHLDRQACNFAAKIFLAHLHGVMFWDHYNSPPPRPFMIAHRGHTHEIKIPHTEKLFPGFAEAYYIGTPLQEAAE